MRRKLDVGDTLGEVFSTYREHAGVLLPVAFWLFLVVAIVNGLAGSNLALFPLVIVVSTIVGTLYQGMVVGLVRVAHQGGEEPTAGELLRFAAPVLAPLIGAGILSGIGIGIGTVLLVVPGLILLTIWAVIAPAIAIEQRAVIASFRRSRELVRGSGWPVFGVVIVAYVISIVGALIFGQIAGAISDGAIVHIVFSALASTITAPIVALAASVLYYRLLAIEGLVSR